MKQNEPTIKFSILFHGQLFSVTLAFAASVFESCNKGNPGGIVWSFLEAAIFLLFIRFWTAKSRGENMSNLEIMMLIGNIVAILFGVITILITDSKIAGVALVTPSLIAIIYVIKKYKTTLIKLFWD